jgi:site-specific DNA-methyltransferase (adenine-specific)
VGGWGIVRLIAELDTMIELLNCDCMEYMATVPDKYFDLAIVDPPYGLGMKNFDSSKNRINSKTHSRKNWDRQTPQSCYFDELFRVSKNQIVWGANHFISKFALDSSCWLVWDKDNGESDYSDCELAWCSFSSPVRKFKYRWAGMLQENMKNKELRIHPTQKPVALYEWLLTNYAKKGQRILDTHLGSGSSAIAAHYFGVDFVGCELDKDYFDAAKARFDMATKQLAMSI